MYFDFTATIVTGTLQYSKAFLFYVRYYETITYIFLLFPEKYPGFWFLRPTNGIICFYNLLFQMCQGKAMHVYIQRLKY